jgi:DNA-binding response OmpR family regulator
MKKFNRICYSGNEKKKMDFKSREFGHSMGVFSHGYLSKLSTKNLDRTLLAMSDVERSMPRVLIVEDNHRMAEAIRRGLVEQDFFTEVANDGAEGCSLALRGGFDAIVLDIMLPVQDGLEVCRSIREGGILTPILLLTALGSTVDKVKGLNCGADDYLTKPFEFDELIARLRALTRRVHSTISRRISYGTLELDLYSREAIHGDRRQLLSNKEFSLLEFFMNNADKELPRSVLCDRVWDMPFESKSNVVDVYVKTLRKKMETLRLPPLIHTLRGIGYVFGMQSERKPNAG